MNCSLWRSWLVIVHAPANLGTIGGKDICPESIQILAQIYEALLIDRIDSAIAPGFYGNELRRFQNP